MGHAVPANNRNKRKSAKMGTCEPDKTPQILKIPYDVFWLIVAAPQKSVKNAAKTNGQAVELDHLFWMDDDLAVRVCYRVYPDYTLTILRLL